MAAVVLVAVAAGTSSFLGRDNSPSTSLDVGVYAQLSLRAFPPPFFGIGVAAIDGRGGLVVVLRPVAAVRPLLVGRKFAPSACCAHLFKYRFQHILRHRISRHSPVLGLSDALSLDHFAGGQSPAPVAVRPGSFCVHDL